MPCWKLSCSANKSDNPECLKKNNNIQIHQKIWCPISNILIPKISATNIVCSFALVALGDSVLLEGTQVSLCNQNQRSNKHGCGEQLYKILSLLSKQTNKTPPPRLNPSFYIDMGCKMLHSQKQFKHFGKKTKEKTLELSKAAK